VVFRIFSNYAKFPGGREHIFQREFTPALSPGKPIGFYQGNPLNLGGAQGHYFNSQNLFQGFETHLPLCGNQVILFGAFPQVGTGSCDRVNKVLGTWGTLPFWVVTTTPTTRVCTYMPINTPGTLAHLAPENLLRGAPCTVFQNLLHGVL